MALAVGRYEALFTLRSIFQRFCYVRIWSWC